MQLIAFDTMGARGRHFGQQIGLTLHEEMSRVSHLGDGFVTWTLWEVDRK